MSKNKKTISIIEQNAQNETALKNFATENLKNSNLATSSSVIENFATHILNWLNTEYKGKSLQKDLIIERIYTMAKYKGEQKDTWNIIISDRNTTFENNVLRAYLIAEIWYFHDDSDLRNTEKSDYLYFKNNKLLVHKEYIKTADDFKGTYARCSLEKIKDVYNAINKTESEASRQKSLLRKIQNLNEETFKTLIRSFVKEPNKKEQKQGNKEISFKYDDLAEKSQLDFQLINEATQDLLKVISTWQNLLNYVNDENNFDLNDPDNITVQVSKELASEHLKTIKAHQKTITGYKEAVIEDQGIEEHTQVA